MTTLLHSVAAGFIPAGAGPRDRVQVVPAPVPDSVPSGTGTGTGTFDALRFVVPWVTTAHPTRAVLGGRGELRTQNSKLRIHAAGVLDYLPSVFTTPLNTLRASAEFSVWLPKSLRPVLKTRMGSNALA